MDMGVIMVKWNRFVEWAFLGLISYFAWSINSSISDLQKGISELNKQVVVLIQANSDSKHSIRDHEIRIRLLEKK